jgi:threonine aldolase
MSNPRFASDNAAGAHPAVLDALARVNVGTALAYGHDPYTAGAVDAVRRHLGEQAEVFLVWGGTAANVLALRALVDSHQAVLCADRAHLWSDECGAPEKFLGCKLLPVPTRGGKIDPEAVVRHLQGRGVVHHAQPRVLSVSQSTELGTAYTPGELEALARLCREQDLLLHVDGARLANAAAHLEVELRAISVDAGVDVVSLGGTKNGLIGAEVVAFLRPGLAGAVGFHRKQGMQLASKMRFLAAQIEALFGADLWRTNAAHANAMARRLSDRAAAVAGVEIAYPVQSNAVLARLPRSAMERLRQSYVFHVWEEHPERPVVRWMAAFDTNEADVDAFLAKLEEAAGMP